MIDLQFVVAILFENCSFPRIGIFKFQYDFHVEHVQSDPLESKKVPRYYQNCTSTSKKYLVEGPLDTKGIPINVCK